MCVEDCVCRSVVGGDSKNALHMLRSSLCVTLAFFLPVKRSYRCSQLQNGPDVLHCTLTREIRRNKQKKEAAVMQTTSTALRACVAARGVTRVRDPILSGISVSRSQCGYNGLTRKQKPF